MDKWYHLESSPANISWIKLATPEVTFQDIQAVALHVAPELTEKEVTQLMGLLKELQTEILNSIILAIPASKHSLSGSSPYATLNGRRNVTF